MSNINLAYGSATSLTVTGLSTLANGSFATSNAYDATTNKPLDALFELSVTVGTVSGNKQVIVYAIDTLDGTNYSDSAVEANMRHLATISTPTNSSSYRSAAMSLAQAFGGNVPPGAKIVVKNDSGAALTAGSLQYREVTATVT